MTIEARPTYYRGILMRSRLEARVAEWLDRHRFSWAYEPFAFADQRGQYLPDFALKGLGVAGRQQRTVYMEVKPTGVGMEPIRRRMTIIWSSEPQADLLIMAPPDHLDFAFGRDYPNEEATWPHAAHMWASPEGHAGEFQCCTECGGVTLTIWSAHYACARCGAWDGDHHLGEKVTP